MPIDRDLPSFLFSCPACQAPIPDPDKGVAEGVAKGGGFSSMKLFCSAGCADSTTVEAALKMMDDDGSGGPAVDINGDVIWPTEQELTDMRNEHFEKELDDLWEQVRENNEQDDDSEKPKFEAEMKDPANWSTWVKGSSTCQLHGISAGYDIDTGVFALLLDN